jgi:uncharacterized protein with NRDE domain
MCLILFAWRSHPQHKLLVAANRDEFYSRPATAAHFWQESPHILAGRDAEKGGTWLGVTRRGRFAAVTNVRKPGSPTGNLSRGKLVQAFLDSNASPAEFLQQIQLSLPDYSPFNLLICDGEQLHYINNDGDTRKLQPGLYGLSNAALDTPWPKVVNGKQQLFSLIMQQTDSELLFELLAGQEQADDEELPDTGIDMVLEKKLSARFIHMDGYGTRCSTVLMQSHDNHTRLWERQFGQDGQALNTIYHAL